jgi:hypothetical protein
LFETLLFKITEAQEKIWPGTTELYFWWSILIQGGDSITKVLVTRVGLLDHAIIFSGLILKTGMPDEALIVVLFISV